MNAPTPGTVDLDTAARATRAVTRLSVGVALVLMVLKGVALGASGSTSMLASLADSSLDLVASLSTFFAVRWAAAPPDAEHRHGHGKAEALAALVQAGLVFASALFVGWEALRRILDPRPIGAGGLGIGVMLVSIGLTLWLVWAQTRAVRRSGSLAVSGDRAHYASDLVANLVALIGIGAGAFLHAPGLDAAAGLIVAVWLFWGAVGLLRQSADHLLDREVDEATQGRITTLALDDPRVLGIHNLRTRMAGSVLMIQAHADLDPDISLEAAHGILVAAERRILAEFLAADILLHPDPRGRAQPHGGAFGEIAGSDTAVPPVD